MANQPLVSWYAATNQDNQQINRWDIGVVNASEVSQGFEFLIWNNRKGDTDVPDMQNAVFMTKDEHGGNTGELVEGQWIEVKVDQKDSTFHKVGWDALTNQPVAHPLKASGSTTFNGVNSTPNTAPHTTTNGEVSILGVANDGSLANSKGNFVKVTLQCRIPGNASQGLVNFRSRTTFQFV
ncbi:hypothetical protein A7K91_04930 [Paenibacillus oryzae]|uniref:Uncharacterized protein n=1 Tax=Paenibacillus oryzae TaxID=1844972 RepID=A0A1A5YH59_9BACL|nr:hypothetical protein [Paenibacillus oryzae]OBR64927.1 hypothetical protein A7K91_04930 [Paenibacillus oryzae]